MGIGLLLLSYSHWLMTRWTPDVSQREIIVAIVIRGAAMGLLFTPIQVLAFVTLAPSMQTEGAVLFSRLRTTDWIVARSNIELDSFGVVLAGAVGAGSW